MNAQYQGIRTTGLVAAAVAAVLAPLATALPAEVDTAQWKCTQCPFETGGDATIALGAGNVSDQAAKFADYTGLDEGGYVIASVDGRRRTESGWFLNYEGRKLGLDSREGAIAFGKEGRFRAELSYDAIPKRTFDDTLTPFLQVGKDRLTLPAGWVASSTTAGMTGLTAALRPVEIRHDREAAAANLDWRVSKSFDVFANIRREEKQGTGVGSAGNFTTALQFAEPLDSSTDSYEFGVKWTGQRAHLRLAYFVQKYDNALNGITWDNPFVPFLGSATTGRAATAPDNESKQFVLNAGIRLALDTTLGFRAMLGNVTQDAALLPFTTSTTLSPGALPRASLNGDLDVTHFGLTLASRPIERLRVRGFARYDERQDKTPSITFANGYVESDLARILGAATPERYGYERMQGELEGEYQLFDAIRLFVGTRGEELKRTNQDVDKTTEGTGYSGIRVLPAAGVSVMMRIGETHKDAADTRTPEAWENPSFWKYNLANRDRDFGEVKLAWTPAEAVTFAVDGQVANDKYRRSPYGLKEGYDRRWAGNVAWMPQEGLTVYADYGYQVMKATQTNLTGSPAAEWGAVHKDRYKTLGAGARWTGLADRWDLSLDYAKAKSEGAIDVAAGGVPGAFPDTTSDFRSVRASVGYKVNDALKVMLGYRQEKLETADWALQGVQPATVATLLALGADPYNYDLKVVAVSFRYEFGGPKKAE